jgi:hypothetical protein
MMTLEIDRFYVSCKEYETEGQENKEAKFTCTLTCSGIRITCTMCLMVRAIATLENEHAKKVAN